MEHSTPVKLAYTIEEAADQLSLSRAFLYRLVDSGDLGSVLIGRSRRVTAGQLATFVKQLEGGVHHGKRLRP